MLGAHVWCRGQVFKGASIRNLCDWIDLGSIIELSISFLIPRSCWIQHHSFFLIRTKYLKLCTCIFEDALIRSMGHRRQKLVIMKFNTWFIDFRHIIHMCCCSLEVRRQHMKPLLLSMPGFNFLVTIGFLIQKSYYIQHICFLTRTQYFLIFFCLAFDMIRGFQVSFSAKTSQNQFFNGLRLKAPQRSIFSTP